MLFNANFLVATTYILFHCHAWQSFGGSLYYRGNDHVNFQKAVYFCESLGSVLTSIHSKEENAFVKRVAAGHGSWIGLSDQANEGSWKWLDGSAYTYSNWGPGSPEHNHGVNNALFSAGNGFWYDYPAGTKAHALCKKTPTSPPTGIPTSSPTNVPTVIPTGYPTNQPTDIPTGSPTNQPTDIPTVSPTNQPTDIPTESPTNQPTGIPTGSPTSQPTGMPTGSPTAQPTGSPTNQPTGIPTGSPSPQPSYSQTRCNVWTEEVARKNCPVCYFSKTFGIKACSSSYQKRLEVSLANQLYGTCRSKCVYDYDNLKGAFFYVRGRKCYRYETKGRCFKMKKYGEAMRQILERQLKKDGC